MAGIALKRRCPGSPTCTQLIDADAKYCAEHARLIGGRRPSRVERGYDQHHVALRSHFARELEAGKTFTCAKCCKPVAHGDAWDLGHSEDRRTYTGPEHAACNRSHGGKRGAKVTNARRERSLAAATIASKGGGPPF